MTPRLKEIFNKEIQPALKDKLGLKNIFMAPRIEKVILNIRGLNYFFKFLAIFSDTFALCKQ